MKIIGGQQVSSKGKDETGNRYGQLTVVKLADKRTDKNRLKWVCQCDCGKITEVPGHELRNHKTGSCGCSKFIDRNGKKYGKLTVIRQSQNRTPANHVLWVCKCDCGVIKEIASQALSMGQKSCGCDAYKINEIGNKYGKLTVIGRSNEHVSEIGRAYWQCQCDCGRMVNVRGTRLRRRGKSDCGCTRQIIWDNEKWDSRWEIYVAMSFRALNVYYQHSKYIIPVVNKQYKLLKYKPDFTIMKQRFLEVKGSQKHTLSNKWKCEQVAERIPLTIIDENKLNSVIGCNYRDVDKIYFKYGWSAVNDYIVKNLDNSSKAIISLNTILNIQ